jgi:hypothetical protein
MPVFEVFAHKEVAVRVAKLLGLWMHRRLGGWNGSGLLIGMKGGELVFEFTGKIF